MILSGMFMISGRPKLSKAVLFALETMFYSVVFYVIAICVGVANFSTTNLIKAIFPFFYEGSWFIGAYLLIYTFSPFINKLLNSLTYRQFSLFCTLCILCWSFIPTLTGGAFYLSDLIRVFVLYCLGGFLKVSVGDKRLFGSKNFAIFLIVASSLLLLTSAAAMQTLSFYVPSFSINFSSHFYATYSFLVFGLAYGIVLLGNYLKPFHSKFINIVASTSLGIYLIHDNESMRLYIWNGILNVKAYESSPYLIVNLLISSVIVFAICCLIDLVRQFLLEKPFAIIYKSRFLKLTNGLTRFFIRIKMRCFDKSSYRQ